MNSYKPFKGRLPGLLLLGLLAALMMINSCDEYNIVEPRFYSEDDIVEFGICERRIDTLSSPTQYVTTHASVDSGGPPDLPVGFGASLCWDSRDEQLLLIYVFMPAMGALEVSILNSGGGVESVQWAGPRSAGIHLITWLAEEDGVYAISAHSRHATEVVWFEVKR
ncbi:MAG: hypothetical protein OEV49_05195 [candidate division Zixibacteria bacterium]|nr:hypothetical protein [candidate division Zixibacteria bacterium]MDH3939328.1 hypothetical protein [candidate division Zixibacteria bacterium]MDH4034449.1 hypothetical protein [candidate division Zixibacteria bacterium]